MDYINNVPLKEQENKKMVKTKLFIIALFLLADSRFFYLIPLPDILGGATSNKTLVAIVSLVCFIWMAALTKKLYIGNYANLILLFYIFIIFQAIFEHYEFHYAVTAVVFNTLPFLVFLMYFALGSFLRDNRDFELFCLLCEWITVFLSICLLLQIIIYNRTHVILLNFTLSDWYMIYHVTAKGRFTVVAEGFMRVSILLSFYNILNRSKMDKWKRKLAILSFLLGLAAVVFVDQSRMYVIQCVIVLLFMYFIAKKNNISVSTVLSAIFLTLIAIILLSSKFSSILNTLGDSSNGSNYARFGAINYYLSIINHYLFTGIGIVIPDEGTIEYFFVKGAQGIYNFDDIGIFGILASMGILMVAWYLFIIVKNFRLSFLAGDRNRRALALGLSLMMLTGILTASYLDKERLMALVLTMAIIDFCAKES